MGRLFWKFFAFVWIAQLAGIVAIASVFWLGQPRLNMPPGNMDPGASAGAQVRAAAAIVRYAGIAGFNEWTRQEPHPDILAVDDSGQDSAGRPLAAGVMEEARLFHKQQPESPLVMEVTDAGGHRFLLFASGMNALRPWGLMPGGEPPGPGFRNFPPLRPIVATLLASMATAFLLASYVVTPIRSLRFAFNAVADGNLALRVSPLISTTRGELADLGRDFDRMTERLQSAMEGQRRLLHDVSHELRSPLARLQAAVGIMAQKQATDDPMLERVEEEIGRIDRLIGDLLKLSRLEAGEDTEAEEDVDLFEIIREILITANFEAQASGTVVAWQGDKSIIVRGRPELLHVALENVVRNAIKHAPNSREILIETAADPKLMQCTIRVLDCGPGVPPDEINSLFTPFFRSGNAAKTDGYGLGLAIARRSILAHHGVIRARNRPEGGLSVEIVLPIHRVGIEPRTMLSA